MKKLAAIMAGLMLLLLLFSLSKEKYVYAETLDSVHIYSVQKGDSLFDISVKSGVSEHELKQTNHKKTNALYVGEKLILPKSIAKDERDLLVRLVHAEAKGEAYEGKVAVALVVLNRVEDKRFPNTIKDVIYAKNQFQPVANGSINKLADEQAEKAVMEALALKGQDDQSVYFFNPKLTSDSWIRTRTVTKTIGNHLFAK